MDNLKQPEYLKMEGDMAENWRIFRQRFELFISLSGAKTKLKEEDGQLVELLAHCMGPDAMKEIFNSFVYATGEDPKKLETVMKKMEAHCKPTANPRWERWQLKNMRQSDGEKIDAYVARLRVKAKDCNFHDEDEGICDHIIHTCQKENLRDKLWRLKDPKLADVISTCRAYETSDEYSKQFKSSKSGDSATVAAVKHKTKYTKQNHSTSSRDATRQKDYKSDSSRSAGKSSEQGTCGRCGDDHIGERCPAIGRICSKCGRKDHYAAMCRTPKNKYKNRHSKKSVRAVDKQEFSDSDSEEETFFCGSVTIDSINDSVCTDLENDSVTVCNDLKTVFDDQNLNDVNCDDQMLNDVNCDGQMLNNVNCDGQMLNDVNYDVAMLNDVNCDVQMSNDDHDVSIDQTNVCSIDDSQKLDSMFVAPLLVNNEKLIPFKLDTGAVNVNLMTKADFMSIKSRPNLTESKANLNAVNDTKIAHEGKCRLSVKVGTQVYHCLFYIVPTGQTLLGDRDCVRLGLVKRVASVKCENDVNVAQLVKQKFPKLFSGTGCLSGEHKITLKPDAVPVIQPMRRVPHSRLKPLKKLLDAQVDAGFISPVDEPTAWVNQFVMVEKKNGNYRLCIDPKNLNDAIMREHYPIPRKDDILADLTNGKVFSKLDASSGFHQVQLDYASSLLTTFNTPYGRYRYLRLPMGISSASEVFHKKLEEIVQGLNGVRVYIDDIIVWGTTVQDHDRNLFALLDRLSEACLVLNFEKCQFKVNELIYLGEVISENGCKPDPGKIQAIRDFPTPKDKHDVQRLLGMVNFLNRFIPNLSPHTKHIRSLLQNDCEWNWSHEHQREFTALKNSISQENSLAFFDPSKPIKLSNDASKDGLGACLLIFSENTWKPVAYASRGMTRAERNYAQIEKELLAISFACERFHNYIYGLDVLVETDHRPLISIFKKSLYDTPARLQRLRIRLQKYNLKLEFVPGKQLIIADTLSRAYTKCENDSFISELDEDIAIHVCSVKAEISLSEERWRFFADETLKDRELQVVIDVLSTGEGIIPKPYVNFLDELDVIDGVLLKGKRVIVPSSLRAEMLDRIHEGHMGREKCKRRAREHVYWPNMNQDIDSLVEKCGTCQSMRYAQPREPLLAHDKGDAPYEKVGCDLFYFQNKTYLIVTDYYSHYPEIALLSSESSSQVIVKMKSIFARWGIPGTVMSDNGPQFASLEFRQFAQMWEFNHINSSPHYPRSNGLVENSVKIVKRLLEKALKEGQDPYLSLLAYRETPLECGRSPAELIMGRKLRTRLPSVRILRESIDCTQNGSVTVDGKRPSGSQLASYNKGTRSLKPLVTGQTVRVRNKGFKSGWSDKGQVVQSEGPGPRSYIVRTERGATLRRNRSDLLSTPEEFRINVPDCELPVNIEPSENLSNSEKPVNRANDSYVNQNVSQNIDANVRVSGRTRNKPKRLIEEC